MKSRTFSKLNSPFLLDIHQITEAKWVAININKFLKCPIKSSGSQKHIHIKFVYKDKYESVLLQPG